MQISHVVPVKHLGVVDAVQDFVVVNPDFLDDPEYVSYIDFKRDNHVAIVLDGRDVTGATKLFNIAEKCNADEIILPRVAHDQEKTVALIRACVKRKKASSYRLVVCPQGQDVADFYHGLEALSSDGTLSLNSPVTAIALDAYEVAKLVYPNIPADVYGSRPGMVDRIRNSRSTQHLQIYLLGLGDRGGRELAEYRYVTIVTRVVTAAAYRIAAVGAQLGLPTKGTVAKSSMDFELELSWEEATKRPLDINGVELLSANARVLKGLAGS
jgi:hypothetical protein